MGNVQWRIFMLWKSENRDYHMYHHCQEKHCGKQRKHAEHGYTKRYYIDTAGPEIPFIGIIGGGGIIIMTKIQHWIEIPL